MWSAARRVVGLMGLATLLAIFSLSHAVADPTIPPLTGRVVDAAGILSDASERDLTNQLAEVERETGVQIVVATLPSLGRYPIETWGLALGRGWKIGRAGRDDGIVIIVAPNDREARIEVGYGLEGQVTDAAASNILEVHFIPAARIKQYAGGLRNTIGAIERRIGDPTGGVMTDILDRLPSILIITLLIAGVLFILYTVFRNVKWEDLQLPANTGNDNRRSLFDDDKSDSSFSWSSRSSSSFGSSSRGGSSFSGRGGSFGGGGASGKW